MDSIEALKDEDDASFKEKVLGLLKTQSSPPDLPFSMLDLKPGMIVPPQAAASKPKPANEVVDLSIDHEDAAHPVLQNPSVAQKLHDHRAKKAEQPRTVAPHEDDMANTFTREEAGLVQPTTPNPRMRQIDITMSSPPARASRQSHNDDEDDIEDEEMADLYEEAANIIQQSTVDGASLSYLLTQMETAKKDLKSNLKEKQDHGVKILKNIINNFSPPQDDNSSDEEEEQTKKPAAETNSSSAKDARHTSDRDISTPEPAFQDQMEVDDSQVNHEDAIMVGTDEDDLFDGIHETEREFLQETYRLICTLFEDNVLINARDSFKSYLVMYKDGEPADKREAMSVFQGLHKKGQDKFKSLLSKVDGKHHSLTEDTFKVLLHSNTDEQLLARLKMFNRALDFLEERTDDGTTQGLSLLRSISESQNNSDSSSEMDPKKKKHGNGTPSQSQSLQNENLMTSSMVSTPEDELKKKDAIENLVDYDEEEEESKSKRDMRTEIEAMEKEAKELLEAQQAADAQKLADEQAAAQASSTEKPVEKQASQNAPSEGGALIAEKPVGEQAGEQEKASKPVEENRADVDNFYSTEAQKETDPPTQERKDPSQEDSPSKAKGQESRSSPGSARGRKRRRSNSNSPQKQSPNSQPKRQLTRNRRGRGRNRK